MGVRGLKDFVADNAEQLYSPMLLKKCQLIIDGFNLVHELYYKCRAETAYSGDYDVFAVAVMKLLALFDGNGIEVHFVFDGISDLSDSKFATAKSRAEDRIHLAGFSTHRKRAKILPILAFKVTKSSLHLFDLISKAISFVQYCVYSIHSVLVLTVCFFSTCIPV